MAVLEERLEYLRELYDLMGEFNIGIPPDDMNEFLGNCFCLLYSCDFIIIIILVAVSTACFHISWNVLVISSLSVILDLKQPSFIAVTFVVFA